MENSRITRKANALLIAITVCGLGLRLYHLTNRSFWIDEGFSYYAAKHLRMGYEMTPPLYFGLLHVWMRVCGDSEIAMRLLSVIFGTLSIWLLGRVGFEIVGRRAGLAAALLMAVSVFPIHYSREVRTFSLHLFLALASYLFLLRGLRTRSRCDWLFYSLVTAAFCYSHNFSVFTLLAHGLYVWWAYRRDGATKRQWLKYLTVALVLFAPWTGRVLLQTRSLQHRVGWIPRPAWDLEILGGYIAYLVHPAFTAVYFLLAILGWWVLRKRGLGGRSPQQAAVCTGRRNAAFLLTMWLLCPIAIPFLISQIAAPMLTIRYTIGASPAFYLLIGIGYWNLPGRVARATVALLLAGAAIGSFGWYDRKVEVTQMTSPWSASYVLIPNFPYREASSYLREHAQPDDVVLVTPALSQFAFNYYNRDAVPFRLPIWRPFDLKDFTGQCRKMARGKRRMWLVSLISNRGKEESGYVGALDGLYHHQSGWSPDELPQGQVHLQLYDVTSEIIDSS